MDSCFSNIFQFGFIFWILYKIINSFYDFFPLGRVIFLYIFCGLFCKRKGWYALSATLVSSSRRPPAGIVAEPNQISFIIGHLTRDADLVAVEVVGLLTAFGIAFTDQTVVVVIVEMQDDAVRTDNAFYLAFVAVLITGNASHCIGMAEQTAQVVAFHQVGTAVGKHPFGQLIVVVVMILLSTAQYVGYLGVTFVIGKTPFLAQRSPVADDFAGRGVMVVFVFRYQSGRIRMRHHQIVFIAEAAFEEGLPEK